MNKPYTYPVELQSPYPSTEVGSPFPVLNLQQIVRTVRRRFWTLVAVVMMIFAAVAYVTFTTTPLYKARANVIMNDSNTQLDLGALMTGVSTAPGEMETELEVITSPVLLERVVRKHELNLVPEFNPRLQEPTQVELIKAQATGFVKSIISGGEEEVVEEEEIPLTPTEQEDIDIKVATAILRSKIAAGRSGRTRIITIEATSVDPEMSMILSNAVADQYLVNQLDAKFEATRRANAWLEESVSGLRDDLSAAERAVEVYRSEENLLSARGQTLTESQIAETNGQLISSEAKYSEMSARLNSVREQIRAGSSESIAEALNSNVVRTLRVTLAQVVRERAELETRYGPRHPDVVRIVAEEQDLQNQIDQEINRIVTSLESEVRIARERMLSLRGSVASLQDELARNNQAMIKLRELERTRDSVSTLLNTNPDTFHPDQRTGNLHRS